MYFLQRKDQIAVDIQKNYYLNFGLNFIVGPLWVYGIFPSISFSILMVTYCYYRYKKYMNTKVVSPFFWYQADVSYWLLSKSFYDDAYNIIDSIASDWISFISAFLGNCNWGFDELEDI